MPLNEHAWQYPDLEFVAELRWSGQEIRMHKYKDMPIALVRKEWSYNSKNLDAIATRIACGVALPMA